MEKMESRTKLILSFLKKEPFYKMSDIKDALDKNIKGPTSEPRISGIMVILDECGIIEINTKTNKYQLTSLGGELLNSLETHSLNEILEKGIKNLNNK
ncbi:MAG: hypothetical protein O8C63_00640 [Candidatus Methanoperedens sp.]|nr:hypothetical protein [Candidatus Methanoperedens sp.]